MIGTLFTFRRCPYAMRARLALRIAKLDVEMIEVDLKNKPQVMLDHSPKGTVPVLVLNSGEVIDESLEILRWVFEKHHPEDWLYVGQRGMEKGERVLKTLPMFIEALNRYKYASRYDKVDMEAEEAVILDYFLQWNELLKKQPYLCEEYATWYDIALLPFVRQANIANEQWLKKEEYRALSEWFENWINSEDFQAIMIKK